MTGPDFRIGEGLLELNLRTATAHG